MLATKLKLSYDEEQVYRSLIDYATWPTRSEDEKRSASEFLREFIPHGNDSLPVFICAYEVLVCDYFKTELCDLFSRLGRREFVFHTKFLLNQSTSPHLRFHAAIALARLGFQDGLDFLEREFLRNRDNPNDAEVILESAILSALRRSIQTSRAIKLAQRLELYQMTLR